LPERVRALIRNSGEAELVLFGRIRRWCRYDLDAEKFV